MSAGGPPRGRGGTAGVARSLACPRCGGILGGDAGDAWLVCLACAEAWETRGDRRLAVRFAEATGAGGASANPGAAGTSAGAGVLAGPGPALPLFRWAALAVRARALSEEGAPAVERLAELRTAWALASRVRRFQTYGDIGLEYTKRPPRLAPGGPPARSVAPARTLRDAEAVLRVLVAKVAAEVAPPGTYEVVEIAPGEPELWLVPAIEDGTFVKLPHCAVRYPAAFVEGYAEARAGVRQTT